MKNHFTKTLVNVLSVASLLLPAMASAMELRAGISADVRANVEMGAKFCTNLATWSKVVTDRLAFAQTNLDKRGQEMSDTVDGRKSKRATGLASLRVEQDQDRAGIYAKLTVQATTDAQKAAVLEFQTTMDAAVKTRRAAVDAAMTAYWNGVDNVMANRKASVLKARQDLAAAVQAAIATATSECAAGTLALTVREHFAASIKTSLTAFMTARKDIDKSGPQIKALVATRNAAVKAAVDAFKATAEQARVKIKASFKAS